MWLYESADGETVSLMTEQAALDYGNWAEQAGFAVEVPAGEARVNVLSTITGDPLATLYPL